MKPVVLLTILFFCSKTYAQYKGGEIIEDRLLTWDDFRGRHKSDIFDALTSTFIDLQPRTVNPSEPIPKYTATCYFLPKESSVSNKLLKERPDSTLAYVLNHEQGHYNLARIATAQINKYLSAFNYNQRRSVYQADSIFRSVNNQLRLTQLRYDKETNHSKLHAEQAKWDKLIEEGLKEGKLPD